MKTLVAGAALALLAGAATAQELAMKHHAGMRLVCGGAGAEERAALSALRAEANLELLFVTARRGGYLADADISLYAPDGGAPRVQFHADGPICLMAVPAGRYRIEAILDGVKQARQASAPSALGKPVRIVFQFSGEAWDGVWASDEEKQQAKDH